MSESSLRKDPVTGMNVSFFNASGKPASIQQRTSPPSSGTCSFCEMAEQIKFGSASAWSGGAPRPVITTDEHAFVVPNRWSAFGEPPEGFAELAIPHHHHTEPSEMGSSEWASCLAFAHLRYEIRRKDFANVYASMNVGRESGASMEHLHFHIVGSQHAPIPTLTTDALTEDLKVAKREALLFGHVDSDRDAFVYVPYAPAFDGEIRIQAGSPEALNTALRETVAMVENSGLRWAYNVLISYDHNFAQMCFRIKPLGVLGMIADRRTHSMLPGDFKKLVSCKRESSVPPVG